MKVKAGGFRRLEKGDTWQDLPQQGAEFALTMEFP